MPTLIDPRGRIARDYRNARRDGTLAADAWQEVKLRHALDRSPYSLCWTWEPVDDPAFGPWTAALFSADDNYTDPIDAVGGYDGDAYGPDDWSIRQALGAFAHHLDQYTNFRVPA